MSIVRLFDYDVAPIVALLPYLADLWTEESWLATMPYSPHKDSQTIFLRRQPGSRPRDVLYQLASVATRHYGHAPLGAAIDAICAHVEGRPARAMLVRLPPGGVIQPHADEGIYAAATERFHVPIVTNPGAWFWMDDERYHLPVGGVFAFDKHIGHSGGNRGDTDRIHMVIDVFPDSPTVLAG